MNKKIETILSDFLEDSVPAHGLPAAAYNDSNFWDIEGQTIFTQNWVFVGFAHSLEKPGDALPVTIADQPIVLIKNASNEIKAFHNVCRHRCLKLVDEPKNVGAMLCCPYHSWTYNLDGELCVTPFFGGKDHQTKGFDLSKNGLKPVRINIWHDWIFINLSDDAPEFMQYAAPLIKYFEDINFAQVEPVATLDFGNIKTNWKLLMENYIEPYHVQFVHNKTTNQPLQDHYTIVDDICLGSAIDLDEKDKVDGSLSVSSRYLTMFPNFIIGRYFPDQIGVHLNLPVDSGQTQQKRVIYTTEGQTLSKEELESLKKLWWDVHKEDHAICERLQLGRSSPIAKKGGFLSPYWEDSVLKFQKMVAEAVIKSTDSY